MGVITNPASALLSGSHVSGATGGVMDARACRNYGYLYHATQAHSAQVTLQASFDRTAWQTVATYTATTTPGTAQLAGYFPYLRGVVNVCYSGGGNTAQPFLHYSPGLC